MSEAKVLLTCPHYGSEIFSGAARGLYGHPSKVEGRIADVVDNQCSLLAFGFNQLWAIALSMFDKGLISHFAMLHADIDPQPCWVDDLLQVMEEHAADVVSVVVPIKDGKMETSTAIDDPRTMWEPLRKIGVEETHRLPETFSAADCGHPGHALLINTGCWLVKLGDWARPPHFLGFTIQDKIVIRDEHQANESKYKVFVSPEDWNFSRDAHRLGLKVRATTRVQVRHWGSGAWNIPAKPPARIGGDS